MLLTPTRASVRRVAREGRVQELPPPLPPENRTVGQLVAETVRFYRDHFWQSVALGLGPAVLDAVLVHVGGTPEAVVGLVAGPAVVTASFVGGSAVVSDRPVTRRRLAVAFAAGIVVFLPFRPLLFLYILPAVAWLAAFGLAVPAAVIEGTGFRRSITRGFELARADFVHALGSVATLAITFVLTRFVLFFLIRGWSGVGLQIAAFLADLVISPILFLGTALLYFDQAARVESRPRQRRRDADLHPAVKPHRARRADAEVEPRPAPRGQP
jgi:hypothetical protein